MNKVDKLINIVRMISEEGMIANVVGNGEKSLGYNIQTGTPPVGKNRKKTRHPTGGKGSRRWWINYLKDK